MLKKSEQNLFYQQLGSTIKSIRIQKSIKQETLALQLGFTRNSISNIESGRQKIQLHSLVELAICLQVELANLLPDLDAIKSHETSKSLQKKISNSEISNNTKSIEKIIDFIRFSTSNTNK